MDILLGNQSAVSFSLESDGTSGNVSDTIVFGNSMVGNVEITNFKEGNSIASDTLDFSVYGINDISELDISTDTNGADTIIAIASDSNFGQIKLVGVVHTDLVDANFDFA